RAGRRTISGNPPGRSLSPSQRRGFVLIMNAPFVRVGSVSGVVPPFVRGGKLVRRKHALTDARPRAGADRPGAAPLQEAAGAERDSERGAEGKVLREARGGAGARGAAQAGSHPKAQSGGGEPRGRGPRGRVCRGPPPPPRAGSVSRPRHSL